MIKKLVLGTLGVLALAIAGLLLLAGQRPDTFRVERRAVVQAPPPAVQALMDDLRRFNEWNPYARKDPSIRLHYRGPASGPGAAYDFEGNENVGRGSIAIQRSEPGRVEMQLQMSEPFALRNDIVFTLAAAPGGATEVSWAMSGASPLLARVAGLFFDMDRMIGTDFETGLTHLKALAEKR